MTAKTIGACIDARCTRRGARNMQITEEFIGSGNYEVQAGKVIAVASADSLSHWPPFRPLPPMWP